MADSNEDRDRTLQAFLGIGGPILFTAPHGEPIYRGNANAQLDENHMMTTRRKHGREANTSTLAIRCAMEMAKFDIGGSFCIWNWEVNPPEGRMDPNYLVEEQFAHNKFHQALHQFALANNDKPILHVDLHGKLTRNDDTQHLDIGTVPMEVIWEDQSLHEEIGAQFQEHMSAAFERKSQMDDFQWAVEVDPRLHGYWCQHLHTISHQGIRLGIPALQLEIPPCMRRELVKDEELLQAFVETIRNIYNDVICPRYADLNVENIRGYIPIRDDLEKNPVIPSSTWDTLLQEISTREINIQAQKDTKKKMDGLFGGVKGRRTARRQA